MTFETESDNKSAVAVREVFRKEHRAIGQEFMEHVTYLLNAPDKKITKYFAGEEWANQVERLVLEFPDKSILTLEFVRK